MRSGRGTDGIPLKPSLLAFFLHESMDSQHWSRLMVLSFRGCIDLRLSAPLSFLFAGELARQSLTRSLLTFVPRAFIEAALCAKVVLCKRAVHKSALGEDATGESRSAKDTVVELDFNELREVE